MSHGPTDPNCLNCGTALEGKYCHECGQKAASLRVGVHDLVHDATHEFLHLDGKIVNTMKLLLFRPGQLTREFLDGRRVRYISPIRLYLTWSVLFFALVTLLPQVRQSLVVVGETKPKKGIVVSAGRTAPKTEVAASKRAESEAAADRIGESIMHQLPRVMFVLMPIFALLTWLAWRRNEPYYVPHLYNAIHFHAFVFFLLTCLALLSAAGEVGKVAGSALFLTSIPYHYVAARKVFGGSRTATIVKGTVVGVIYWLTLAAALAGLAIFSVRNGIH